MEIMMSWYLNMNNDGLCIQENFIAWMKVVMMSLLMVAIHMKKNEDRKMMIKGW
jgi:hypothetical protein